MSKLCIDIGIKNLALCVMKCEDSKNLSSFSIQLWDVFNILEEPEYKCQAIMKNKKICNKKCLYKYTDTKIISEEIFCEENMPKQIEKTISETTYCCKSHFPKSQKIKAKNNVKNKKVNDYLLQDIVKIFLERFQKIYEDNLEIFKEIKEIYIELQIKCNPKMKLISHILFGKLIDLYGGEIKIRFVSAVKKLKAYTGPYIECKLKNKYSQRKWLGIQYCKWFLKEKFDNEECDKWMPILLSQKKSDDMADTFLMCINCLTK